MNDFDGSKAEQCRLFINENEFSNGRPVGTSHTLTPRFIATHSNNHLVKQLDELVEHRKIIHKGEHLFRFNEPLVNLPVIASGCCKHYIIDNEAREHISGFSFAGEILGLEAIYCGCYHHNAKALDTMGLGYIPKQKLCRYIARFPVFGRLLFNEMSQKLDQQMLMTLHCQAKNRVARFLLLLAQKQHHLRRSENCLLLIMTRQDIANYLCLRAETVSRILTRLKNEGLIEICRNSVELKDTTGLSRLSGLNGTGYEQAVDHRVPETVFKG